MCRTGSPRFLDAYLLAAKIEGFRFFQTRDAKLLDDALGLIGEARRIAPEDPLPLDALVNVALNAGRLDEAEEALKALEQRLPGDARTLQQRAMLSERRGDRRQALALQRQAVERRPSAQFLIGLANLEMRLGEMAAAQDIRFAPHCSIGPVALAAALHLDISTPNFMIQEAFAEFDVPWRNSLVRGWNPIRNGEFTLDDTPGLGLELDDQAIADHPYIQNPFPSLWDSQWVTDFTQDQK